MAARDIAGRRYALALIDLAREQQDFEGWEAAVNALDALTGQRAYVDALQADGMTDEQLVSIVQRVAPALTEQHVNLFRLLRRKHRLALGPSIASFFQELLDEERGIVRATATSAVELDEQRRAALMQRLSEQTGKQVELETSVDSSILGGLIVRIGDRLIDGSTRSRLRGLRQQLERAAI